MNSRLPNGWRKIKLGNVVDNISERLDKNLKEVVTINTSDVLDGEVLNHAFIPNKDLPGQFIKKFNKNDILFSEIRPINKRNAYVDFTPNNYIASSKLMVLRTNQNYLEPFYFFYYITCEQTLKYLQMLAETRSGTFPQIRYEEVKSLDFVMPPLVEQGYIIEYIKMLDNKIENNNRVNENLEQQAQEIFKRWFVDFEFLDKNGMPYKSSGGEMEESELGIIPKGWEVKELLEVMDFQGGSQPPKKEHLYEEKEGYIRFIQNRDYAGNPKHLTYIPVSTRNKLANKYDILIDKYGEAGKTRYGIAGAYNVALAKVEPKNIENREYIRRFLEQKNIVTYLYNASIASTRPSLNRSTFTGLKFAMPTYDVEKEFNDFSLNIIDIILKNKEENRKLARLRDTLLPKLMSGELRIPLDE